MTVAKLLKLVVSKEEFRTIESYLAFCGQFLEFIENGIQARIVSQNESCYEFLQYRQDGSYNITRPLNSNLMLKADNFTAQSHQFLLTIEQLRNRTIPGDALRSNLVRTLYTVQQSIGAALDALPSGKSNQARKINGDLFERLIRLVLQKLDLDCISGTIQVPVRDEFEKELFKSSYQHDLLISEKQELKVIGSVKTSSKDRIDKVFLDKFLYCRLTGTSLPHIAVFLNDVQRKKTSQENKYGVSATFLPGHFKAYTIKLNPLDGVYYCDIRPNMISDPLLAEQIKTIDHFFFSDLWALLKGEGKAFKDVVLKVK